MNNYENEKLSSSSVATLEKMASRRELLKGLGLLGVSLSVPSLLVGCGNDNNGNGNDAGTSPQLRTAFTLPVLPDTQFYARYATQAEGSQYQKNFGSEPFMAQTFWVAQNAQTLKMPMLVHLGDIVDQANKPAQWEVASSAMLVLENAKVPYSVLAGNHDVLSSLDYVDATSQQSGTEAQRSKDSNTELYLKYFNNMRASRQSTFKGRDPSGWHEYHIFEAEGQKYMVLSLSWRIADSGIDWANSVIAANPTLPVILVNHQLLNIDKDGVTPLETPYGLMLWEKLIRKNDQIFMTLNGHHHGAAYLRKKNDAGNDVHQMVVDYQMAYQGGNGLMRLYEFDLTNNKINVLSFSPWVVNKPKSSLNSYDQAVLSDANNQFSIDIDFKKRFARFAPNFSIAAATVTGSLLDKAKQQLLKNFTQPEARKLVDPKDANDYPTVPNTVAHWRFMGGTVGTAVAIGQEIKDAAGSVSSLTRAPLNVEGVQQAELNDVIWSADCHRYSACRGSVEFLNANKNIPRMSYFMTAADAPANMATLKDGYTVEAFIKIGKNFKNDLNRWMNIMTRDGQRVSFDPSVAWEDKEAPPLLFAISNLREIQWDVAAYDGQDSKSAWSGEIMVDQWVHVAIVNDPTTHDTTMYVEGSPMLRGVQNKPGIGTIGKPWVVGGGTWDKYLGNDSSGKPMFETVRSDGFVGNIGEVRIVAGALPPEKWLTARRA